MADSRLSYKVGAQWARMSWSSRLYACLSAALFVVFLFGAAALTFGGRKPTTATSPPMLTATQTVQLPPPAATKPAQPESPKPKDPNAIPDTWAEFSASARKEDRALVAQIEKMDVWKQCIAWGPEARKKARARRMWALQASLQSRGMINGIDLGGVTGRVPEIGMTTCGALAVMGSPSDINRTKTVGGERIQFVWSDPRVYAYTQTSSGDANALIHSVQY